MALRTGFALILAMLVHLSVWQTLAGIRLALPNDESPVNTIEAALLPPVQQTARLPVRHAVVHELVPSRAGGSAGALTSVNVDARPKHRARPSAAPMAPKPAPRLDPLAERQVASADVRRPVAASPQAAPSAPAAAEQPTPPSVAQTAPQSPLPAAAGSGVVPAVEEKRVPAAAGEHELPAMPAVATAAPAAVASAASTPASGGVELANLDPNRGVLPTPIVPPQPPVPSLALPDHGAVHVMLPRSARLVYESNGRVRVGGLALQVRGHTTTSWSFRDGHYKSDLSIDVASFAQSSQGSFEADYGLTPDQYVETRRHNTAYTTSFDWTGHHVSFSDGRRQQDTEPGVQDRLSVQFQLAVLRQVYPERFVRGGVMPITLAGTRDVSHWTFTVTGEDVVDSGIGRVRALRVLSNRTTETGDESLEVWIAERLDWFPVRIRIVDKNRNIIDSVLTQADIE